MRTKNLATMLRSPAALITVGLFGIAPLYAQEAGQGSSAKPTPSVFDQIWSYSELYRNDENPVIQRVRFTGRFQLDYAIVDADQGDHEEWNIRRFRLGTKATVFKDFTLHGEIEVDPEEPDPFYDRMTDMYLSWSRHKNFVATIGKHSAPFTLEGSTSSKELLTIDRGNVANNLWFPSEYFPGVSMSGEPGKWRYLAGIYSSGGANPEFGDFSGGHFLLSTVGYDFGEALGAKEAVLAVNYVHNDPDAHNTWTRSLEHVGSLNFSLDNKSWGLRSDISGGLGYRGQSDLWGAMIMPYYNLTDKLQAVARFTYLNSQENNGVRLASYENQVAAGQGDQYEEIYLGLNYYFYSHKLKLQSGVQHARMRDRANDGGKHSGWAWTTGVRISW